MNSVRCEYCGKEFEPAKKSGKFRKRKIVICPNCGKFQVINMVSEDEAELIPYSEFIQGIFNKIGLIYSIVGLLLSSLSCILLIFREKELYGLMLGFIVSSMGMIFSYATGKKSIYKNTIGILLGFIGAMTGMVGIIIVIIL